jgi:SPP1 family predicted phage head-tail adaptor
MRDPSVTSGLLRFRVTLQQPVVQQNTFGEAQNFWQDVATVWANVNDLAGFELWRVQQINAEISIRVTCRARTGIAPRFRVLFGQRILEIVSVSAGDNRRRMLDLLCKEAV